MLLCSNVQDILFTNVSSLMPDGMQLIVFGETMITEAHILKQNWSLLNVKESKNNICGD